MEGMEEQVLVSETPFVGLFLSSFHGLVSSLGTNGVSSRLSLITPALHPSSPRSASFHYAHAERIEEMMRV